MQWLSWMSGPIGAAARYMLTALGVWLVSKGFDQSAVEQIIGGLLAIVPSAIGVIVSTASAKKQAVAAMPDVLSVETKKGSIRG